MVAFVCTVCGTKRVVSSSHRVDEAGDIEFNNFPTRCDLFSLLHFFRQFDMFRVLTLFIQTYQYNGPLITEQNRGEQNPLFQLSIDTGLTS